MANKTLEPLYGVWASMRRRCDTPSSTFWHRYGGRGISVCSEWDSNYDAFRDWALGAGYKQGLVIDRIDNDGNYTPENCRWVNRQLSAENRSDAFMVTAWGETKNVSVWVRDDRCAVADGTLRKRIRQGWDPEEAISVPPNGKPRRPRAKLPYCINGHPLNDKTTRVSKGRGRTCIECAREGSRRYKARQRAAKQARGVLRQRPAPVMLTAWGETQNVSTWARDPRCVVQATTVYQRIRQGWDPEDAISLPAHAKPRPPQPKPDYCVNGHPLNEETTRTTKRDGYDERVCIECARERSRRYKQRIREKRRGSVPS